MALFIKKELLDAAITQSSKAAKKASMLNNNCKCYINESGLIEFIRRVLLEF